MKKLKLVSGPTNVGMTDYSGAGTRTGAPSPCSEKSFIAAIDRFNKNPSADALRHIRELRLSVQPEGKTLGPSRCLVQQFDLRGPGARGFLPSLKFNPDEVEALMKKLVPTTLVTVYDNRHGVAQEINLCGVGIEEGPNDTVQYASIMVPRVAYPKYSWVPAFTPAADCYVDLSLAAAAAYYDHSTMTVKGSSDPDTLMAEKVKKSCLNPKLPIFENRGTTHTIQNTFVQFGGTPSGLMKKMEGMATPCSISYVMGKKSFLPVFNKLFVFKHSDPTVEKFEEAVQLLNRKARPGGLFMGLSEADKQSVGAVGAEGAGENNNQFAIQWTRGTALQILAHFCPTSEFATIAAGLDLPPATEASMRISAYIAPKFELVSRNAVAKEPKTRPYGIWPSWLQVLCATYGSHNLETYEENPDSPSGVGINFSWGKGPAKFYAYVNSVLEYCVETNTFRFIIYGDDLVIVTPDGIYSCDTKGADYTINAEEMEYAVNLMLPKRDGWEDLRNYLIEGLLHPLVLFGKRAYRKEAHCLLSGMFGTSQVDIIALTVRYLSILLGISGKLKEVIGRKSFDWSQASYNPKAFAVLKSQCAAAGVTLSMEKFTDFSLGKGDAPMFFLSSRFAKVPKKKGGYYIGFVPSTEKVLASFAQPATVRSPPVLAWRALGFLIMFPEMDVIFQAATNAIMSLVGLDTFKNIGEVGFDEFPPEVTAALNVVGPLIAHHKKIPDRHLFIDFKYAGKHFPLVPAPTPAAPKPAAVVVAPQVVKKRKVLTFDNTDSWADEPVDGPTHASPSLASPAAPPLKFDRDIKAKKLGKSSISASSLKSAGNISLSDSARLGKTGAKMLAQMNKKASKKQEKMALFDLEQLEASVLKKAVSASLDSAPTHPVVFGVVPDEDQVEDSQNPPSDDVSSFSLSRIIGELPPPPPPPEDSSTEEEDEAPPLPEAPSETSEDASTLSSFSESDSSFTDDESDEDDEDDTDHQQVVDALFVSEVQAALAGTPLESVLPVIEDNRPIQEGLLIASKIMKDRAKALELATAKWASATRTLGNTVPALYWSDVSKLKYGEVKPAKADGKGYLLNGKMVLFKYRASNLGPELKALEPNLRDALITNYGFESK